MQRNQQTANTTIMICRRRRMEMLRWGPLEMTLMMSISFPLTNTENIWGKWKMNRC